MGRIVLDIKIMDEGIGARGFDLDEVDRPAI